MTTTGNRPGTVQERPAHWFKPGVSGNPAGRARDKAGALIRQYEQEHSHKILHSIVEIGLDTRGRPRDRLRALTYLMDRAYGRPREDIEIEHTRADPGPWRELPTDTLMALLRILDSGMSREELDRLIGLAQVDRTAVEGERGDQEDTPVQPN